MVSKKKSVNNKPIINKTAIYLFGIIFIVLIIFLEVKFSGYVISTFSGVRIDEGIIVIYNNFSGDTTDFLHLNDSQLSHINNLSLEILKNGKIKFYGIIDITKDVNDNIIDIDNNVFIKNNSIMVNTSALTSFQVPAVIYFYNLTFTNPQILKNGEICPITECQILSYINGTLIFDIINFSGSDEYSSREMPVFQGNLPVSHNGGGGGGGSSIKEDFKLDKDLIKVTIIQGQLARENITIINNGARDVPIDISLLNLSRFMVISENHFILKVNESKIINIDIFARDDIKADSYFGNIIVKGLASQKIVNVIIDVKEKKPIFDISTNIFDKNLIPGSKLNANITLMNKGDIKYMDILLDYIIKNFSGTIIISNEESIAINKTLDLEREFIIPKDIIPGDYLLYVKVIYGNESAASSDNFRVIQNENPSSIITATVWVLIIVVVISIIIIIYLLRIYLKKFRTFKNMKKKHN